ncbi:MAG: four helix bundle protein [Cyanobacteria bacterium J06598_4]
MQDFTQLSVWQKAHNLTINVYKLSKELPSEEKFGLISQIRRCCISIESNLAEGCPKGYRFAYGRDRDKEFARFVDISMGSSFELRCQLLIARDLGYLSSERYQLFESKILEINRMLGGLLKKLRA